MQSEAHIATGRASHYIKTLCRHFSHRVQAEYTTERGDVTFQMGTCEMLASETELILRANAESKEHLEMVEGVVGRHLEEFAYRGETIKVEWQAVE